VRVSICTTRFHAIMLMLHQCGERVTSLKHAIWLSTFLLHPSYAGKPGRAWCPPRLVLPPKQEKLAVAYQQAGFPQHDRKLEPNARRIRFRAQTTLDERMRLFQAMVIGDCHSIF